MQEKECRLSSLLILQKRQKVKKVTKLTVSYFLKYPEASGSLQQMAQNSVGVIVEAVPEPLYIKVFMKLKRNECRAKRNKLSTKRDKFINKRNKCCAKRDIKDDISATRAGRRFSNPTGSAKPAAIMPQTGINSKHTTVSKFYSYYGHCDL